MFSKFAPMPGSVGFAVFKRNVACVTSISFPFSGRGPGRRKRASERANERAWGEQKMERSREEWARRRGDEVERTLFFLHSLAVSFPLRANWRLGYTNLRSGVPYIFCRGGKVRDKKCKGRLIAGYGYTGWRTNDKTKHKILCTNFIH